MSNTVYNTYETVMDATKDAFCDLVLNANIQNYLSGPLDQVAQCYQYPQTLQGYL